MHAHPIKLNANPNFFIDNFLLRIRTYFA